MRNLPRVVVSDIHSLAGDLVSKSAERGHRADVERDAQMAGGPAAGMTGNPMLNGFLKVFDGHLRDETNTQRRT